MRPRVSIRGSVRPSVRPKRVFSMNRLWEKMVGNDYENSTNSKPVKKSSVSLSERTCKIAYYCQYAIQYEIFFASHCVGAIVIRNRNFTRVRIVFHSHYFSRVHVSTCSFATTRGHMGKGAGASSDAPKFSKFIWS